MRCHGQDAMRIKQCDRRNAMRKVAMRCEKDVRNRTSARALFKVKLIIDFLFITSSVIAAIFSFKELSNNN